MITLHLKHDKPTIWVVSDAFISGEGKQVAITDFDPHLYETYFALQEAYVKMQLHLRKLIGRAK